MATRHLTLDKIMNNNSGQWGAIFTLQLESVSNEESKFREKLTQVDR